MTTIFDLQAGLRSPPGSWSRAQIKIEKQPKLNLKFINRSWSYLRGTCGSLPK